MKILHCLRSPHIGGIERFVIEFALFQKNVEKVDVSIMFDTFQGDYFEFIQKSGIQIFKSNVKSGFEFDISKYKLIKSVFNQFDIINLHSFSPILSFAAINSKAKVVYTIHGLSKNVRKEFVIKYIVREALKKFILKRVNCVVANSEHTMNLSKKYYNFNQEFNRVILNGVDTNKFFVNRENQNTGTFTIGLVSRFTKRKRIERLIEAFEKFYRNNKNVKLVLVGDGETFADIKNRIQKLGLNEAVEMVGFTKNVKMYYEQFDVFVNPSDNEGFGLVAVEAYLAGLPVLIFGDSGGMVEVVKPFEPENVVNTVDELCLRLEWYHLNQKLSNSLGSNRIQYAIDNFSLERMAKEYSNLYNQIN